MAPEKGNGCQGEVFPGRTRTRLELFALSTGRREPRAALPQRASLSTAGAADRRRRARAGPGGRGSAAARERPRRTIPRSGGVAATTSGFFASGKRSEERRVGKECRIWWSTCHQKKKERQ